MIPHSSRELIAVLLQLIQQLLNLDGLLRNLRTGHGPGIGIGVNQTQLLECWRNSILLNNAGRFRPALRIIVHQHFHRLAPTVTGNDHVSIRVRNRPDADRLLQTTESNIGRQIFNTGKLIKIVWIFIDQCQRYVPDLFPFGAQVGHIF